MANMITSKRNRLILLVIFQILNCISCQIVLSGSCPTRTPADLLNLKEIHGTWYELERSPILNEFTLKCLSIRVQQFYNQQAQVDVSSINRFSNTEVRQLLLIQAEPDFLHTGKLTPVKQSNGDDEVDNFSYQILSTDYKNYLVLWGCQNYVSSAHSESLWIFSRSHHLSNHIQSNIMDQIHAFGLSHLKLQTVHQSNCT